MSDSMKDYNRHVERAAERASREVAKRAAIFRSLTDDELLAKLDGASPWERAALRRVLRERGES